MATDRRDTAKGAAREELRTGLRAARPLERMHVTPHVPVQCLAILEGTRESLKSRVGTDVLLVQRMVIVLKQQLRWQNTGMRRTAEENWHGERYIRRAPERMSKRERHEGDLRRANTLTTGHEPLPPRRAIRSREAAAWCGRSATFGRGWPLPVSAAKGATDVVATGAP